MAQRGDEEEGLPQAGSSLSHRSLRPQGPDWRSHRNPAVLVKLKQRRGGVGDPQMGRCSRKGPWQECWAPREPVPRRTGPMVCLERLVRLQSRV